MPSSRRAARGRLVREGVAGVRGAAAGQDRRRDGRLSHLRERLALRSVETHDFMTADWAICPTSSSAASPTASSTRSAASTAWSTTSPRSRRGRSSGSRRREHRPRVGGAGGGGSARSRSRGGERLRGTGEREEPSVGIDDPASAAAGPRRIDPVGRQAVGAGANGGDAAYRQPLLDRRRLRRPRRGIAWTPPRRRSLPNVRAPRARCRG